MIIFLLSYPSINLKIKYKNKYTAAITSSLWSYSIRVSIAYLFESLHGILLSILRHFTCRSTSQNAWQPPSFTRVRHSILTAACISVSSKLFSWVFLSRIIVFVLRQRIKKFSWKKSVSGNKWSKLLTSLLHFVTSSSSNGCVATAAICSFPPPYTTPNEKKHHSHTNTQQGNR